MAAIGELFKTLGKNEIFNGLCKKIENGLTNNEIIDEAINNEELISILKNIIDDIDVIKNKMDVIIGQKRKGFEKQFEKKKNENLKLNSETNNESYAILLENTDKFAVFNYKPYNKDNVVWINEKAYLEKDGLKIRMVFYINEDEYEMFY